VKVLFESKDWSDAEPSTNQQVGRTVANVTSVNLSGATTDTALTALLKAYS
jgi:hypothetical protein